MAARSLNKVMLIGNLTRDPEVKKTASGAIVCTFGLATNSTWRTADKVVEESTEFHSIVCWNKLAEICGQLLRKGMKVYVEGEIRTRTWEDESGEKRYRKEIRISDMIILTSSKIIKDHDEERTITTEEKEEDEGLEDEQDNKENDPDAVLF